MSTLITDPKITEPRTIKKRYVFRLVEKQRAEVVIDPKTKEKHGPVYAYGIIIKVETDTLDRAIELAKPVADQILDKAADFYGLTLRQIEIQENVPDDDRDV